MDVNPRHKPGLLLRRDNQELFISVSAAVSSTCSISDFTESSCVPSDAGGGANFIIALLLKRPQDSAQVTRLIAAESGLSPGLLTVARTPCARGSLTQSPSPEEGGLSSQDRMTSLSPSSAFSNCMILEAEIIY